METFEPVATTTRRNVAAWASGFFGVIFGIAVGALWRGSLPDSLSAQQFSTALGIRHWRYTVPPNSESQYLRFEFRDGDVVKTSGGSSGWKPGETVTVTVRPLLHSRKLECSIIGKDKHSRIVLDNPFASLSTVVYANDGTSVRDVPLIKGSHNGNVTVIPSDRNEPGDVSLWVVMAGKTPADSD